TRWPRDWSSDVCSSDLKAGACPSLRDRGEAMKISGRLVLAMVLLVVAASCMVGAFAYYFVADAPPRAVLMSIISATLAGGGIAEIGRASCREMVEGWEV